MAEEEVNYASVVFKSKKQPPPEAKREEETVYDEVKKKGEATEQTADANAGVLPDRKASSRHRHYQQLAGCLGILCVILLLGLIAVCYFLATLSCESDKKELNQLKENSTTLLAANHNLTNRNVKLSLDNDNLRMERNNLTVQLGNLTQNYTVLESKITNLTTQNQQLETEKNNLTEQIQNMETNWNELNVSRAQWSIDAYYRIDEGETVRTLKACQAGWKPNESRCYATNNPETPGQKTWEQARGDCGGKSSDLAVVHDQREKVLVDSISWGSPGYWIGLRVEDRIWKWIDGTNLTESSWIEAPAEGHCATSAENKIWTSVMCNESRRWICEKEALTV